ncbi:MAG: diacylglycerol kinase family lipid kinase [Planctomycetes bacterium]|nr:diacylglycerol kinase family lipid kinase [Planctomycetota bacterium]
MTATPPPEPPRRLLVIANPISGGGRARVLVPRLCAALQQLGVESVAFFTTRAGEARERAATAGAENWDGLIAAGGDGTMNEVVNGMPDPTQPLGFLPVGTANVLSVELGLPRRPELAARVFANGHLREHAIGECDGRRFLLFVGAGLDGALVERLSAVRTGTLGKHKWLGPILWIGRRWPRHSLRATLDDGTVLDGLTSVLVTRSRNYGGVVSLLPDIDPADGMLHVLGFRMRGRLAWAWQGVRAGFGRLRPGRHLVATTASTIVIEGVAPYHVDGDHGGTTPATIRLLPRPLRLYAPAPNR